MDNSSAQSLFDAVARGATVVLSLPAGERLVHHRSGFLGENDKGVWVRTVVDPKRASELISSRHPIGVSFRGGDTRHVFAAPILAHDPDYELPSGTTADALLLGFPTAIKAIQRRSSYRVRVSTETELKARCWRLARRARLQDKPLAVAELPLEVRDISLGGLGVNFLGTRDQPPRVACEDRLRVELRYRENHLLLEGRMRKPDSIANGCIRAGVRFVFLQEGIRDRKSLAQLTRIVGQLQREEARLRKIRKSQESGRAA